MRGVVGIPGGWLVATAMPPSLTPLDATGTLGTPLPIAPEAEHPTLAYGAGQRVLLAWNQGSEPDVEHVYIEIADTSGTIVVPPFELFSSSSHVQPSATSDGTSFFVAAEGALARIAPDGTHSFIAGFPPPESAYSPPPSSPGAAPPAGTCGRAAPSFDASGAPIGARLTLRTDRPASGFTADGNDVVALQSGLDGGFEIVRIDPDGHPGAARPIGAGAAFGALVRVGGDFIVAWVLRAHLQLARVAP
ncbi:MAG TPA: hypothetical protein VK607_12130 [Kofleriaceae bacterium]|nr:hypothetical protein [Kofleriaceae bacterium]